MVTVPEGFREEVDRAAANGEPGRLGLLAWEAQGFSWESEGFRIVALNLMRLQAFESARRTWKRLQRLDAGDVEANRMLGTLDQQTSAQPQFARAIVFTGHMIDSKDRSSPRFPREKAGVAKDAMRTALLELAKGMPAKCIGFAGAASGGDLIFHELCHELGIVSRVRLTLPPGPYMAQSVSPANADWEDRFRAVVKRLRDTLAVLGRDEELPAWLRTKQNYNVWGRTNVWLLEDALAVGAPEVHLLALWNGEKGDDLGGTEHLIALAKSQGVTTHIVNTNQIFGLDRSKG